MIDSKYGELEDKILDEIYRECGVCEFSNNCPKDHCALFRIEQLITHDKENHE